MRALACLDCSAMLPDAVEVPSWPEHVECACGLVYSIPLIDHVDDVLWERVRAERLFVRVGDTAWMTKPVEAIRDDPRWVGP